MNYVIFIRIQSVSGRFASLPENFHTGTPRVVHLLSGNGCPVERKCDGEYFCSPGIVVHHRQAAVFFQDTVSVTHAFDPAVSGRWEKTWVFSSEPAVTSRDNGTALSVAVRGKPARLYVELWNRKR
jgi:hypothetical protein